MQPDLEKYFVHCHLLLAVSTLRLSKHNISLESPFGPSTFTTLGTTGRLGPTTLGNHYRGQDHEHLVTLQDGIQHFTVPWTGIYSIEAAGSTQIIVCEILIRR